MLFEFEFESVYALCDRPREGVDRVRGGGDCGVTSGVRNRAEATRSVLLEQTSFKIELRVRGGAL